MKVKTNSRLAIFDRFSTKGCDLTGEAKRHRAIITILASDANPARKTRPGISQSVAKENKTVWKNIYSGIFRDIDEILLPMGIIEENGRLPLKRGPKALQEKGMPFYHLTRKGVLVALSINETQDKTRLLSEFFSKAEPAEREFEGILVSLMKSSPNFVHSIFYRYVKAFSDGKYKELLPFDLAKLSNVPDDTLMIQKEVLEAFLKLSQKDRDDALSLLDKMT